MPMEDPSLSEQLSELDLTQDYLVVCDEVIEDLEAVVNHLMMIGWKPTGGVSVSVWPNGDLGGTYYALYTQAMIKGASE